MKALVLALLIAALGLPGCRTLRHCKNEGDCEDGFHCNHETEQCEPDPCYNRPSGEFLGCDGEVLVQCDGAWQERLVACGSPGCNVAEERCNDCAPGSSFCESDTWLVCDASGVPIGASPWP